MRITLILFILSCFFDVLLGSPLPGQNSLPLTRRLHDTTSRLIARADVSPVNPTFPPQNFEGCTAKQEEVITKALPHAVAYVKDSLHYLETYREGAPRFKEWFGNPNHEAWKKLQTLFQKMDEHIPHGVYVCSECKGDNHIKVNAYVKPKELGRVYICPDFWKLKRLVGYQSKASVIVHEWSHFDAVGGTLDLDSTVSGCLHRLAKPEMALKNAYSIQYFAENFPPLD